MRQHCAEVLNTNFISLFTPKFDCVLAMIVLFLHKIYNNVLTLQIFMAFYWGCKNKSSPSDSCEKAG